MAKAYWVTAYRSISDPEKLAAYARLAGPAIAPFGGRYLARGNAVAAYEAGLKETHRDFRIPRRRAGYRSPRQRGLSGGAPGAGQRRRARPAHCRGAGITIDSMTGELTADEICRLLELERHATCGFVRLTFTSKQMIAPGGLAAPFADARPLGSALYFMVTRGALVRLHRIRNDQLYHY